MVPINSNVQRSAQYAAPLGPRAWAVYRKDGHNVYPWHDMAVADFFVLNMKRNSVHRLIVEANDSFSRQKIFRAALLGEGRYRIERVV